MNCPKLLNLLVSMFLSIFVAPTSSCTTKSSFNMILLFVFSDCFNVSRETSEISDLSETSILSTIWFLFSIISELSEVSSYDVS